MPARPIRIPDLSQRPHEAESVVTVELEPSESGTDLRLSHAGFPTAASRDAHASAWPVVLEQLDNRTRHNG